MVQASPRLVGVDAVRPPAPGVRPAVRFVVTGYRRALASTTLTAFVGGVAEALVLIAATRAAFAITDGADRVGIVAGWFVSVGQALLIALCLVVIRVALMSFAAWQSARTTAAVVARIRRRLARSFLDAPWGVQQSQRSGSLQELLTSYASQAQALMAALNQGVVAAANLVALVGIAIAVDPLGAIVLVISVAGLGLLLRPLRAAVRRRAKEVRDAEMEFATSVNEVSDLGMELHVFHVQAAASEHVDELIEHARERRGRLQFATALATPVYTGLAYLALLGALAVVALSDATSLTSLGAAMLVMLRSLSYGQAVQGAYTSVVSSSPAMEELGARIDAFESSRRRDQGEPVDAVGAITAEDVTFAYSGDRDVLRGVSFTIEHGEIVGVVGPSGGGKSTLVQLLLGLREPDRGRILLDGRPLSRLDRADLARRITFVPQAPRLLAGTIADNIRFFRNDVTDPDVERASRLAHLHDDVVAFRDGYERQVGERGGQLSGGQQQRLCIARALVEDPDVLIMDEPTSSLDVRSEQLIRTTLEGLKERMTVIIIAHRLSTLGMCDRIMVIQSGELKGFDAPATLERVNDFYREALALSGMR